MNKSIFYNTITPKNQDMHLDENLVLFKTRK